LKRDNKFVLVTLVRAVVISVRSAAGGGGGGGDGDGDGGGGMTPPLPSLSNSI